MHDEKSTPSATSTRRQFVAGSSILLASGMTGSLFADDEKASDESLVKIGIATDLHFADKAAAGSRYYRESSAKLAEAVAAFKEQKVDLVVELGDIVDAAPTVEVETSYLKKIDEVIKGAGVPVHYVLGNHCVATLTKPEFLGESLKNPSLRPQFL